MNVRGGGGRSPEYSTVAQLELKIRLRWNACLGDEKEEEEEDVEVETVKMCLSLLLPFPFSNLHAPGRSHPMNQKDAEATCVC